MGALLLLVDTSAGLGIKVLCPFLGKAFGCMSQVRRRILRLVTGESPTLACAEADAGCDTQCLHNVGWSFEGFSLLGIIHVPRVVDGSPEGSVVDSSVARAAAPGATVVERSAMHGSMAGTAAPRAAAVDGASEGAAAEVALRAHVIAEARRQRGIVPADEVWWQRGVVTAEVRPIRQRGIIAVNVGHGITGVGVIVIVMYHMVHDMHGMANVLRHCCDDGLLQAVSIPSPGAALLLVAAAPALLGLGPAIVPVLDASDAVVVALLNHVLNLRDGNLLVDSLGSHRNGHVDHLARHAHRNGHGLVAVLRRGWHGLRHVVLLRNHLVHDVGRASRLDLDQRRRVLASASQIPNTPQSLPPPKKRPKESLQELASKPRAREPSPRG